jgi:uncharacterized protein (DUF1501 family)
MLGVIARVVQLAAARSRAGSGRKARVLALECETTTIRPANIRSRITNRLRESPAGLDGRSERGRRWRDLLEVLIAEYGTADPEKLRETAALKLSLEAT